MNEKLFNDASELLKAEGVSMTAGEVESFCLGGESLDSVTASELVMSDNGIYGSMSTKLTRIWQMPNSNTFNKAINLMLGWFSSVDIFHRPFSQTYQGLLKITNDLNPDYKTDFHLDAIDFLKRFETESVDFVLYDPPYSLRQVSECYKGVGREVTMETTQASWNTAHKSEIKRILKPNGICMCFGWNSNGIGSSDMELVEVLLVAHGGQHNDTIVTVERKIQGHLF